MLLSSILSYLSSKLITLPLITLDTHCSLAIYCYFKGWVIFPLQSRYYVQAMPTTRAVYLKMQLCEFCLVCQLLFVYLKSSGNWCCSITYYLINFLFWFGTSSGFYILREEIQWWAIAFIRFCSKRGDKPKWFSWVTGVYW